MRDGVDFNWKELREIVCFGGLGKWGSFSGMIFRDRNG